jgi:hypothetical protein
MSEYEHHYVTLPTQKRRYKDQWTKLLDMADSIRAFIRANESSLKMKS